MEFESSDLNATREPTEPLLKASLLISPFLEKLIRFSLYIIIIQIRLFWQVWLNG